MVKETYWLALTLGLSLLFRARYVLNRMVARDIGVPTLHDRKMGTLPLS